MKKVFEAAADMVLPAVVFLAIVLILVGAALFDRIGKRMETQGEDFSQMPDSQTVEGLCQRQAPVIQMIGKKRWDTGEIISIAKVFAAADAEGNKVGITVLDITDLNGDRAMAYYQKEAGQAVFPTRGVYTFSLSAIDGQRKRGTGRFSVLVDAK